MPEYRRAIVPGGTFWFTLVTESRAPILCTPLGREALRNSIQRTRSRWPFAIDAIVLLPDHLHTIWTLPSGDSAYSTRWAFLKKEFTKLWIRRGGRTQQVSPSRVRNRRRGVWQRRFWEHAIRDERDFQQHCDYLHYNPVKHGLSKCPHSWVHTSFHRFVREGHYKQDWQCVCEERQPAPPTFEAIAISTVE